MKIKELLRKTYIQKWPNLKDAMQSCNEKYKYTCFPHLLSTTQEFEEKWEESDLRIMLFGISTNCWEDKRNDDIYAVSDEEAITRLMNLYDKFYYNGGNWEYAQVFWNYVYTIEELLSFKLGKKVAVAWNNTYKIVADTWQIEKDSFAVIREEIEIFQPNIVLTFGMESSDYLLESLSEIPIKWIEKRHEDNKENPILYYLAEPESVSLLSKSVKKIITTYHPNAHYNAGIKMKLMIDKLVNDLENTF